MKTLLLSLVTLALITALSVPAFAQAPPTWTVANKSYARNQTDTVTAPAYVARYGNVTLSFSAADSFNCKTYVQTRPQGGSTWTTKDSVSINTTSALKQEWVLRQGSTNLIPGVLIDVRFINVFAATINTLTSKKYVQTLAGSN